jgi:hypothetical protein
VNALAGNLDANGDVVDLLPARPVDAIEAARDERLRRSVDSGSTLPDLAAHLARIAAVAAHATRVHPLTY